MATAQEPGPSHDWAKIQTNMRHMMRHEAKGPIRPLPAEAVTRAFEKVAFDKVVRDLQSDSQLIKSKTLVACLDLLNVPLSYVQCLAAGITPPLVALLQDAHSEGREAAANALAVVASKDMGCARIVAAGGVVPLLQALQDDSVRVQGAAFKALLEGSRYQSLRKALVRSEVEDKNAIPYIMHQSSACLDTATDLSVLALQLLGNLAHMRNNDDAIRLLIDEADAIGYLSEYLLTDVPVEMNLAAAHLLAIVCRDDKAKVKAVRAGCVPSLVALLTQGHMALAVEASGALSMITVAIEGKYALHVLQEARVFVELLDWCNEQLELNLLSIISNSAEYSCMRTLLVDAGVLQAMQAVRDVSQSQVITMAVDQAVRQCKFQHLPFDSLQESQQSMPCLMADVTSGTADV